MDNLNTMLDTRRDHRLTELAGLFAKGFLRLSKTPEWREQAAQASPSRQMFTGQKRSARSGRKTSGKRSELTG